MNNSSSVVLGLLILFLTITLLPPFATGECTNACSGHGACTLFDMCNCYRNWQGDDCSESMSIFYRLLSFLLSFYIFNIFIGSCLFNWAWSDIPKGDLNADGKVSGPGDIVIENSFMYPYGTTEAFPDMQDTNFGALDNSGHAYAECSNAV